LKIKRAEKHWKPCSVRDKVLLFLLFINYTKKSLKIKVIKRANGSVTDRAQQPGQSTKISRVPIFQALEKMN
jgi:hypothetical protein